MSEPDMELATVNARVRDGVATIELPGRHFVLGVQWHPEADQGSTVVGALVRAARRADTTLARE